MLRPIRKDYSPALGDIRAMGGGDEVVISPSARERKDWPKIVAAVADAVSKGAGVRWGAV